MTIQRSPGSFPDLSPKCGVCMRLMKFAPNLRDSNASRSIKMPRTATRTRMRSSVRPRPWRPSASGSSPRSKTSSPRIRSARLERALVSPSQVARAPLTSRNVIAIAPQLATDGMRGARRAGPQPIIEFRPASPARNISNGDCNGLLLADENHELLATGNAGVEEIPLQHRVVLGHDRDDHGGILRALALVDGGGIGGDQRVLRLLLGGIGDDYAALRLFLSFDAADDDAVVQWSEFHGFRSRLTLRCRPPGEMPWRSARVSSAP